jgi:hypothetical protein
MIFSLQMRFIHNFLLAADKERHGFLSFVIRLIGLFLFFFKIFNGPFHPAPRSFTIDPQPASLVEAGPIPFDRPPAGPG